MMKMIEKEYRKKLKNSKPSQTLSGKTIRSGQGEWWRRERILNKEVVELLFQPLSRLHPTRSGLKRGQKSGR